jgi:hypothetical protein
VAVRKRKTNKKRTPDAGLFGPEFDRKSKKLAMIGEQADIRYYAAPARNVLNGTDVTGMGFWSNQSLYRLCVRLRVLLRAVRPSIRDGARFRRRANARRAEQRIPPDAAMARF